MSLAGEGAVAIWHDIAPEGRGEFYAWHGREHMPERVGIPGFLRGRRYVAIEADLEFFNLYEALSVETLKGQDYTARVNAPTPWTLSAVRHFRSVARSICRVAHSAGPAQGGLMATLRYDVPQGGETVHREALLRRFIPDLLDKPGVAGVHWLVADDEASGVATAEQKARGVANAVPRRVLLLEGWGDEADFVALAKQALSSAALDAVGGEGPYSLGLYRHQITRTKTAWSAG
ncbi:MAG: hypothetical protein J0I54_02475 [Bosea sp.]|uniref:hypothetical protein n=1 Tax=unclassified Bosea (in: a-proteobacteria) TaxID=2653178 RepID=UPI0009621FA8|nr:MULTISPECIES: hypothetical protein [unclassified Bosea (in: a-proteobacteria)]MBN9455472.1 hypothetical protein [Bosea sp. (in: a-proteobacteria)]OJV05069.1 MAG: hypothetical protein BGO20_18255 [Bosea sp. 67-29]